MAKKHPVRTIWRFIYLHLYFVFSNTPKKFKLITGSSINIYPKDHGATGYFYYGLPDYEEQRFLLDYIKTGEVFFDVGANVGAWSLLVAGKYVSVYAFEPVPFTFSRLKENFSLNTQMEHLLHAHNIGLSEKPGKLYFTTDQNTGNRIIEDAKKYSGTKECIKVNSLDSFVVKFEYPNFIKIDVEGHELGVLKGAKNILAFHDLKAIIIETFRWANFNNPELKQMEELLGKYGFIPCKYDVNQKRLIQLNELNEGGQNTIYARLNLLPNG